jgi:hypothetical protein
MTGVRIADALYLLWSVKPELLPVPELLKQLLCNNFLSVCWSTLL